MYGYSARDSATDCRLWSEPSAHMTEESQSVLTTILDQCQQGLTLVVPYCIVLDGREGLSDYQCYCETEIFKYV